MKYKKYIIKFSSYSESTSLPMEITAQEYEFLKDLEDATKNARVGLSVIPVKEYYNGV